MMEIAFGPVVAACALNSLGFGVLFALLFPLLEIRLAEGGPPTGLARRLGLALLGGGLFGLIHLAVVCAAAGLPPRIIQSAVVAFALVATAGLSLVRRVSSPRSS